MVADRHDAGVVGMVMMVLDMPLTVRMGISMVLAMGVILVFEVEMRLPAHIQIHGGQCLKRHE